MAALPSAPALDDAVRIDEMFRQANEWFQAAKKDEERRTGDPAMMRPGRPLEYRDRYERVSVPSQVETFFFASSSVNHTDVTDLVSV